MIPTIAARVPEWAKRIAEATACALCAALANWGVEEVKDRVKKRREAAQTARSAPEPPKEGKDAESAG